MDCHLRKIARPLPHNADMDRARHYERWRAGRIANSRSLFKAQFLPGPLVYEYKNLILLPSGKRISSSSLRVETKCGVIVEWSHPNRIGLGITW